MTWFYNHPVTAALLVCGCSFLFAGFIICRDDIAARFTR